MRIALAMVMLLGGCSAALMESDDRRTTPSMEPRCTGTRGYAAWDIVFATGHAAAAVMELSAADSAASAGLDDTPMRTMAIVSGAFAFVHALSAGHGLNAAGGCERARIEHDAWIAQHQIPDKKNAAQPDAAAGSQAIAAQPTQGGLVDPFKK